MSVRDHIGSVAAGAVFGALGTAAVATVVFGTVGAAVGAAVATVVAVDAAAGLEGKFRPTSFLGGAFAAAAGGIALVLALQGSPVEPAAEISPEEEVLMLEQIEGPVTGAFETAAGTRIEVTIPDIAEALGADELPGRAIGGLRLGL